MLDLVVDVHPQLQMISQLGDDIPDGFELGLKEAAEIGSDWIDDGLNRNLRTQTPYYRIQIRTDPMGDGWRIHDNRVVYGPWLEGVSRRNQTSRFKGYHVFRTVRQRLESEARIFVERQINLAIKRAQQ